VRREQSAKHGKARTNEKVRDQLCQNKGIALRIERRYAMQQRKTLRELAVEVSNVKASKADFVLPSRMIQMTSDARLQFGGGEYETGTVAHEQLATKLEIPKKYYDRMLTYNPVLLANNVNSWLVRDEDRRMVRTVGSRARAFLSDKYRPIDNDVILETILPVLFDHGHMDVVSSEVTERRMYLQVVSPRLEGEVKVGQVVRQGLTISNSDVGLGSARIEPMLYVLSCLNGAIMQTAMKRYHVGKRIESDDYGFFSPETVLLDNAAFVAKIRDTVRHSFDELAFHENLKRIALTAENKIEAKIQDTIENVTKRFDLSKDESESVLKNLINGGDLSQWGLSNAVTEISNTLPNYDRAIDLQRIGGRIIDLTPNEWRNLAA
jgi:hypothetical protein